MRYKLENQEKKLDELLASIDSVQDDELKAHLSKYFCVRISGYLENVIKILVAIYIEKGCPQPVSNFVLQDIKGLTNLSEEKLLSFENLEFDFLKGFLSPLFTFLLPELYAILQIYV